MDYINSFRTLLRKVNLVFFRIEKLGNHELSLDFQYYLCCKTLEELDQCAYDYNFLGNRDIAIPASDQDVVNYCQGALNGIQCLIDDTNECGQGQLKMSILSWLRKIQKHLTNRCNDPQNRTEFLEHVQCLRNQSIADSIRLCNDKHVIAMEQVSNLPPFNIVEGFCGISNGFYQCLMEKISTLCGKESESFFNDIIDEAFAKNTATFCGGYHTMKTCEESQDPTKWNPIKEIMRSEDPAIIERHHYKTSVPIIVKMVADLNQISLWNVFFLNEN